jgi:hypothetical protein
MSPLLQSRWPLQRVDGAGIALAPSTVFFVLCASRRAKPGSGGGSPSPSRRKGAAGSTVTVSVGSRFGPTFALARLT